jgi:MFS family permease
VVGERLDGGDGASGTGTGASGVGANGSAVRFVQADGPFSRYERRVEIGDPGDGIARREVHETVEFELPRGTWRFVTERVFARTLGRPGRSGHMPWWAPPQRPDAHAALVLGILATLSLVAGYLGTLLSQTMTFAASEFNAGNTAQSFVLSAARIGGVLSIALTALADRRGRRRMLTLSLMICIGSAALTAVAPNLVTLAVAQVVNRGSLIAAGLLIVILTAEEMPAGARAWAVSLLAMISALGAGMALWILPVADHGLRAWRILYAVPLLAVPLVLRRVRLLPESRRYERRHRNLSLAGHSSRLWLLAISWFLLNVFIAPQTQFRNEFLRDHRGFSAATISLFVIVTSTPGGIGIIAGGRLAETLGRRVVGSVAIAGGVILTAASFVLAGVPMWITACLGTVIFAAHVASITVYGPELFPTSLRGRANGVIAMAAMGGSVVGLLIAGVLSDAFDSFGPTMALLAIAPLVMAVLIFTRFPETAQRELEELNPQDLDLLDPLGAGTIEGADTVDTGDGLDGNGAGDALGPRDTTTGDLDHRELEHEPGRPEDPG